MKANKTKIILVVVLDIVFFAAILLSFAWFHHAKPQKFSPTKTFNPRVSPSPSPSPDWWIPKDTPAPGETPDPSASTQPTVAPTSEPNDLLHGKYSEKFTSGEVVRDENGYRSGNVCVEMSKHTMTVQGQPVCYYVADIYIKDITSLRCAISDSPDRDEWVTELAGKNNAIVAASGDFFVFKRSGLAIRNGQVYREELNRSQDVCVVYSDGTMATYFAGSVDLDSIYAKNPYHAFSFGPKLLNNGEPMTEFNTSVATWNPRCAIGYYEPGHYCLVVVDGRQRGYSLGLEMTELSKLMKQLGCTEAYNLDGGMTAMMAYGTELYSQPCGGGRQNCDIVYVAEPLS